MGILLIGHGTRDPVGIAEFFRVVEQMRKLAGEVMVEPSFLELAEPSIADGFAALVHQRVQQITAMPVLLFSAGHAKHDIPAALSSAQSAFPQVSIAQTDPLECHPLLLQLSAERFWEVANGQNPTDIEWIFVGRGSKDPAAQAKVREFAAARAKITPVGNYHVAYVAEAEAKLVDALEQAVSSPFSTIVVQPHLLFHGEVLSEIQHHVADFRNRFPVKTWLVTDHLGPASKVAEVLWERFVELINRSRKPEKTR